MKENLKTIKYNDNTPIPNVTDSATWGKLQTGAYCWYNNDAAANKDIYGGLYNWFAVNTGKLCPAGWHVPSHDEWTTLERAVCSSGTCATDFPYDANASIGWTGTDEGGKLKETGLTHWYRPNTGATNSSGFTALPGGRHNVTVQFERITWYSQIWSSTEYSYNSAFYRALFYASKQVFRANHRKEAGMSVRCLKD